VNHPHGDSNDKSQYPIPETSYIKSDPGDGAKSGALSIISDKQDPNLAQLIDAWPTLEDPIRAGIMAMVRAAGK